MSDELTYRVTSLEHRMDKSDDERKVLMQEIRRANSKLDDHQERVEHRMLEGQQIMTRIDTTIKTTGRVIGGVFSLAMLILAIMNFVGSLG